MATRQNGDNKVTRQQLIDAFGLKILGHCDWLSNRFIDPWAIGSRARRRPKWPNGVAPMRLSSRRPAGTLLLHLGFARAARFGAFRLGRPLLARLALQLFAFRPVFDLVGIHNSAISSLLFRF